MTKVAKMISYSKLPLNAFVSFFATLDNFALPKYLAKSYTYFGGDISWSKVGFYPLTKLFITTSTYTLGYSVARG